MTRLNPRVQSGSTAGHTLPAVVPSGARRAKSRNLIEVVIASRPKVGAAIFLLLSPRFLPAEEKKRVSGHQDIRLSGGPLH